MLYLVRKYGDQRHWDAMLVLKDADGREGPVFKSFATDLAPTAPDREAEASRRDQAVSVGLALSDRHGAIGPG